MPVPELSVADLEVTEPEEELDPEEFDILRERDLDAYVKVMVGLRGGSRPILCW